MVAQTLDSILNDLVSRIYKLESFVTTPGTIGTDEFDQIIIDDGVDSVILRPAKPELASGIAVTVGSFYDVIYADVSWTAPTTGEPVLFYEIEVAKKTAPLTYDLGSIQRTAGTNFRIQPLEPDTDYGIRITANSILGQNQGATDWFDFTTEHDNTIPAAVSGITLGRGATSLIVRFTGSTSPDMQNGRGIYLIEIDTNASFASADYQSMRSSASVVQFTNIASESSAWRARVTPIDPSGNAGPATTSSTATAGGVIDSMLVGNFSAAHITFGDMSGDRITSNTASIGILKTSSLTSADITINGGSLKVGSPPTTGLLINSQGISLYAGGTRKVFLDALTGSGSFTGAITASTMDGTTITASTMSSGTITGVTITGATLQTASSGARVEITGISFQNQVRFWTGLAGEINPGLAYGDFAGTTPLVGLRSPTKGGATDPGEIIVTPGSVGIKAQQSAGGGSITTESNTFDMTIRTSNGFRIFDGATGFQKFKVDPGGDVVVAGNLSIGGAFSPSSVSTTTVTASGVGSFNSINVNSGQIDLQNDGDGAFHGVVLCEQVWPTMMGSTASAANLFAPTSGGFAGLIGFATSSERFKTNVSLLEDTSPILDVSPRTWKSRFHDSDLGGFDDPDMLYAGVTAEECANAASVLATYDGDGLPNGINWPAFNAMLLGEAKKLRAEVDALREEVNALSNN